LYRKTQTWQRNCQVCVLLTNFSHRLKGLKENRNSGNNPKFFALFDDDVHGALDLVVLVAVTVARRRANPSGTAGETTGRMKTS
jgi:hypothetical protein